MTSESDSSEALDGEEPAPLSLLLPGARSVVVRVDQLGARLTEGALFSRFTTVRPHPLLVMVRSGAFSAIFVPARVWDGARSVLEPYSARVAAGGTRLILLGQPDTPDIARAVELGASAIIGTDPTDAELYVALTQAFDALDTRDRSESRGKWLNRYRYELGELIEIARAMTTERNVDRLLALILEKSRFVTGADAGSIYVVEGESHDLSRNQLHFKLSQNESVTFDASEFTIPVNRRSMAGYVALEKRTVNIEDVYELPAGSPFGFDRSFDDRTRYRTKSILSTPLVSSQGDVIGVLQLINKKREPKARLREQRDFEELVTPFDVRSEQLLETLAAQAGIALENALLYQEIRGLFEGFVKASVDAIEARDPTTSGHSRRVAELTIGLAHAVEKETTGAYKEVVWKHEDLRELEYASLLHDFGKIGVREHVLVKEKKLFPQNLQGIRSRFDYVAASIEIDVLRRKLLALERGATRDELLALDAELTVRKAEIDAAWQTILTTNEPTVLAAGEFQRIEELGRHPYSDPAGHTCTLLTAEEVRSLSVPRGSLTPTEFDEIRSHVTHTYRFLSQIPWGKAFSRVAVIAGSHHERLNGTGYPGRLQAEEIPLQSKMMSVSDIFDALTASDRPYKRAVPVDRALDILSYEVRDGHIDGELVRIFIAARPWEQVMGALY